MHAEEHARAALGCGRPPPPPPPVWAVLDPMTLLNEREEAVKGTGPPHLLICKDLAMDLGACMLY